ncbi:MAG: MerR family transcriptional regulator [Gammaproteobacteria bacterium]|nr:MerR family transcriptional regulator [Gammaproteobacteria bacterium]
MTSASRAISNVYRIGAVARLTGISADTLRIWERRYNLVEPQRSEKGGRLYSQDDVARLTRIKALVDQGHAISTLANLDADELGERLSRAQPHNMPETGGGRHDVCVVGQAITVRVENVSGMPDGLELTGMYPDLDAFLADDRHCDSLVIEFPFLDRHIVHRLQQPELSRRAKQLIVIYAFSPSNILRQTNRLRIHTERAPIAIDHLWQLCVGAMSKPLDWKPSEFQPDLVSNEVAPKRLFTPQHLAALSQVTSALKCECPNHMSSIIETLVAFEQYSTQCENDTRKDAALHSYLHVMTAKARWIMEVALEKLAEVEQIDIKELTHPLR